MSVSVSNIIPAKQAEAVQTTQYIASGCTTIIDKFTATNTSAVNVTLSVNLVAPSGSVGDSNLIVKQKTLTPSQTYTFPELVSQVIPSSGSISTIASVASSLTISAAGREIT